MDFNQLLKDARKAKNYTQRSFAGVLNVAHTTVAGWETGKREPNLATVKKICQILEVSADYLLGLEH